ncbi:TMhelix containing protein [Vibrio phage V-YDF132]|nr:TMhelix containing protein [Vibrio phage V-YDF132]
MSFVADPRDLVGTWLTKLLLFLVAMCFLGVCSWLIITTMSNQKSLVTIVEQASAKDMVAAERQKQYLDQMGNIANQLSDVANNLKKVSETMYPKDEALKQFGSMNTRVGKIELRQAEMTKDIEYLQEAIN